MIAEQMNVHPDEVLKMTYEEFLNLAMALKMKVDAIKQASKNK